MSAQLIVTDPGAVAAMAAAARVAGDPVTAVVVGPRSLADVAATSGCAAVHWFATDERVPAEAYAPAVAQLTAAAGPRLVLAQNDPAGRILVAAAATALDAALVSSVSELSLDGADLVVRRPAVDGKVVETLSVAGSLAGLFDGEDVEAEPGAPAPITEEAAAASLAPIRVVEAAQVTGEVAGLKQAERVVGLGRGVRKRDDLPLIEALAAAAHAKVACTLPICDDMRWYDDTHVLGTSTQQIAPDLYIAVGVSGQPQHMSGVRAAKCIVAINNDPAAEIFAKAHFGILGDLYDVVPALTAAFADA